MKIFLHWVLYTHSLFLSLSVYHLHRDHLFQHGAELSESSMAASLKDNPTTFKHNLSIKLNNENHLLWKQQIVAAGRSHNLMHYLESPHKPQKFLSAQHQDAGNINVEFIEWEQQDQLLASWLLSSMIESILTITVSCGSTVPDLDKIECLFHCSNSC